MRSLYYYILLSLSLLGVYAGILEEHGYTVEEYQNGLYIVTSPHYSGGNAPLDKVRINVEKKTMTVYLAYNGKEEDHEDKLYMSQVLAALCDKEGIDPDDLWWVVIDDVENVATKTAMTQYRTKYGLRFKDEIRVKPDQEADWAIFNQTPFYRAVYRMLPRKGIDQIIIKREDGQTNMYLSVE
ncbi:hypothetical protein CSPX01_00691 [Colletotrichum filicis]|nr:hypothetical protein CSPX01_00691 [Colletotrichum filicis]